VAAKALLSHIAEQAGAELDVSAVEGVIEGYVIEAPMSAADAMAPVLSYLGLELAERGMGLSVIGDAVSGAQMPVVANLAAEDMADHERDARLARRDLIEAPSALILRALDLDREYQVLAVHARTETGEGGLMQVDLALSLSAAQARNFAAYTLSQTQALRETLSVDVGPLDALRFEVGDEALLDGRLYRVAEIDLAERPGLTLTPVTVRPQVTPYEPAGEGGMAPAILTGFYLLDLPGFGADDSRVTPVVAATATAFPVVDIYAGAGSSVLSLRARAQRPASVGYVRAALPAGQTGLILRQTCLDIYLEGPAPQSRDEADVLGGENFVCVRGAEGEWEIVQFLSAEMQAPDLWRLSGLIRGQWGTRSQRLNEGTQLIMLSEVVRADMSLAERGLPRLWRAGLSGFAGAADGAMDMEVIWQGVGLRPRAPVHGRIRRRGADRRIEWLRCARFDGDNLDYEPPAENGGEVYDLRFYQGTELRREVETDTASYLYAAEAMAADYPEGLDGDSRLEIAQKDPTSGNGLALVLTLSSGWSSSA